MAKVDKTFSGLSVNMKLNKVQNMAYWQEREKLAQLEKIRQDTSLSKYYEELYNYHSKAIEKEIDQFYFRYGEALGLNKQELHKQADALDVQAFESKAKEYVRTKDFSDKANDELKLYNFKMQVSRLDLLQYNLELEMVALADGEVKLTERFLKEEAVEDIERQAGILGLATPNGKELETMTQAVINKPYSGDHWSDLIWERQDELRSVLHREVQNLLIRGRNGTAIVSMLKKKFGVSTYKARRLAITERSYIQADVQLQSFKLAEFDHYGISPEPTACDICKAIAKESEKNPFNVDDAVVGKTMYPFHPHCRCSMYPAVDRSKLDEMYRQYEKTILNSNRW